MRTRGMGAAAVLALAIPVVGAGLVPAPVPGSRPAVAQEPLESLGALLVGTWEAPGSRQVHEWGVGRKLLRSRGYAGAEGDWTLVSEGVWYWDDQAETLRGVHLAVGMPVDRFEYETTVEGDTVVHRLGAFTEGEDAVQRFVETWAFSDDAYEWRLERVGADRRETVMGGTYRRVGPR